MERPFSSRQAPRLNASRIGWRGVQYQVKAAKRVTHALEIVR
jgi:hypothetical protein